MRKSGLTSGTMDHLRRLTAEKTDGMSLDEILISSRETAARTAREYVQILRCRTCGAEVDEDGLPGEGHLEDCPVAERERLEPGTTWKEYDSVTKISSRAVRPIEPPPKVAWEYKEPDSDRDIFMTVLNEEAKDPMAEQSSKLLDDTLKDMRKGPGITPGLSPKRPKGMPKEPLKKDWTLRSAQRFLALLKRAYDIRNFYVEDSEGPQAPVSISASLNIPMAGSERGVNDLEEYVSDVITQALNLGGEHQLIVTAKNGSVASASGATPPPVSVNLEGFDPTKEAELRTLIEGLVVEAVSQFADSRGRTRA